MGEAKRAKVWICPHCRAPGEVQSDWVVCPFCFASITYLGDQITIMVEGNDHSEVADVAQRLAGGFSTKETARALRSPWISGSFYLLTASVLIVLMLVVGKVVPAWVLPVVVAGSLLLLSLVGGLQLRHDDRLSEEGFLKLMGESLRMLPRLVRGVERPANMPADPPQ